MPTKILDNKKHGKVGEQVKSSIKDGAKLSIASAFFTVYAYNNLKTELANIEELRFLFTEPTFINNEEKEKRQYYLGKEKNIAGTKYEIKLKNKLQQTKIAKECAKWLKQKAQLKSLIDPEIVESKLYLIENEDENNVAIHGSSDFTSDGLGFINSPKLDLNIYIDDSSSIKQYIDWFNAIWNNKDLVEDVKEDVLNFIEVIYQENTPEFIYFLTLYNVVRDCLDELDEENLINAGTGIKETVIWNKLYAFQKDGVLGAIDKLEKYNGCIIADSVGLGKTFEALATIK